jgi:DNA-directed DNA polymerase III PolC
VVKGTMPTFPNFPSPHCHPLSLDSASTPEAILKREQELGTGTITCTDHGTMQGCRHVYDIAKKAKFTPILGVEAYFRDDNCPILAAHGITDSKEYAKYMHITLHAMDEKSYYALVKVLSNASLNRMERHGSEEKPLFNWADLEELAKHNITFTTGCLIGMVQRHYLNGRADIAEAYYAKLREIVPAGNLYVEVFPHKTDKQWVSGVFFHLADGRKLKFYPGKTVKMNGETLKAEEASKFFTKHENVTLDSVKNNRAWDDTFVPGKLTKVEFKEDFIENECMPGEVDPDSQKITNRLMLDLATKSGNKVLVSDDAHFATENEKILQDVRLMSGGGAWRFYASYHRFSSAEAWDYFSKELEIPEEVFGAWVDNNIVWSKRFKDFAFTSKMELPTKFYPADTLMHTKKLIDKVGRMNWADKRFTTRLQAEIAMLHANGTQDMLSYFFTDEEVCELYEKNGLLTGPGRGSAAGLLLSYLLGITHVDPLKYGLSKERFMTEARIQNGKWPDIDQDLPSRNLLVNEEDPSKGWLKERFGDHFAQISTSTQLKIRSSIKDVARVKHGTISKELNKVVHQIEAAPQGVEDKDFIFGYEGAGGWVAGSIESDTALQEYIHDFPAEWEIVQRLLGLQRQRSRHACAFVIMNEPVSNRIPLTKIGEHVVTQYNAKSVEASGGLKMDFLVINILNDISKAIKLIQQNSGTIFEDRKINGRRVPAIRQIPMLRDSVASDNTKGSKWLSIHDIWDLPDDPAVYDDICQGKTETVFQLNTPIARSYLRMFNHRRADGLKGIHNIEGIAAFTSLDRPGPLDAFVEDDDGNRHNMLVEFANRANGEKAVKPIPALDELLPETHGIIVYQEQLQKIYEVIGKTTAVEADEFRVHIGKKYEKYEQFRLSDRDTFLKGAKESVGEVVAQQIWEQMYTFGQYGFNKSHAVSYSIVGYACAFLKHHFPLEWWTAVLSNADRNEIDEKFWKYCWQYVLMPDITKSGDAFTIEGDKIRAPLSFIYGVGMAAHAELIMHRPCADIYEFAKKIHQRRVNSGKIVVDKKGKEKLKLGYSSLHRGVVYSLIVSGAMDGLFPPDAEIYQKLAMYESAMALATGKDVEPVDPDFTNLNQITRFQHRKNILPACTEPLLPMLIDRKIRGVVKEENGYYYRDGDQYYRFVNIAQLERLSGMDMLPEGGIKVAAACYIIEDRRFKYQGGAKQAAEIFADLDGGRFKVVKWAGRNGKLPSDFPDELSGSVAILLLNRWNDKKPDFSVDEVILVQPPLPPKNQKTEESP